MRGFMTANGFVDAIIPKRATKYSAGYDFYLYEDVTINPNEIILAKTGIKAYMNDDEVLLIYPRSSLALKRKVNLANNVGVIDKDYFSNKDNDGHIMIPLYNFGKETVIIKKGERVAQGIFQKYLLADDDFTDGNRGGGFGSTNL